MLRRVITQHGDENGTGTNATHLGRKVGDGKGLASFIAEAGPVGVAVFGAFDDSGFVSAGADGVDD